MYDTLRRRLDSLQGRTTAPVLIVDETQAGYVLPNGSTATPAELAEIMARGGVGLLLIDDIRGRA